MSKYKDFHISGGKELERALAALPIHIEKRVAKSAIRAGATVIAREARLRTPVDSGNLKRSIAVVSRSRRVGDAAVSVVTRSGKRWQARGMDAWYAPLIEFGTKNRPATPFFRPAFDTKIQDAIKAVGKKAQERFAKLGKLR